MMEPHKELNVVIMPTGSLTLEWENTGNSIDKSQQKLQDELYKHFLRDPDFFILFLGFCDKSVPLTPTLSFWRKFAGLYTKKLILTPDLNILRDKVSVVLESTLLTEVLDSAPLMNGLEYLNMDVLTILWAKLHTKFQHEIKSFTGTVEDLIATYSPNVHLVGRIYFHLVENKDTEFPFAFLATYSTSLLKDGKAKHLPLKHALSEYGEKSDKLLELLVTVELAAKDSPLISSLLESGELFHPLAWLAKDAFQFLKEIPIYENAGILCRIPNWWKGNAARIKLNIEVGDKKPSHVGMDALVNFNVNLHLDGAEISEDEARHLLQESEGLAYIKNKWVAVDPEKLRQTLDAYKKAQDLIDSGAMNLREALRLQLAPGKILDVEEERDDVGVSNGEWLTDVIKKLQNPSLIATIKTASSFTASLRPYQQKGLDWLYFLHSLQFGACLADDMGLGKTIELLAFLITMKDGACKQKSSSKNCKASLLVIPASLISNWINEIHRFAPTLNYYIAHPGSKDSQNMQALDEKELGKIDLVITTYTMVQKYEWIKKHFWNYVVLDEAQAIKNPGTKQTQSVKKLLATNRIIMTGTPIENRLSDLWSLFDFLNPGLLGNLNEFKNFSKSLGDDEGGYARLRKLVNPYILRRLKTDKTVISDLPDKVEMKTYATLSTKQILLYQNMVKDLQETIEDIEGIQRKGVVLASIMKFKQLCNHPDQYLGTGSFREEDSGKFMRLREICETIYEKREKVLVFTQFKEMTEPLRDFLKSIFKHDGLVLHGSVPVAKRKDLIDSFQGGAYVPFMVLSLKAGGVGLNLTEANHVVHFDRWWNPAVENQATDRAFRIGQKKNVIVHKFLTKGTIEEKIDNLLEEKSKLSGEIIQSSGEKLITELGNQELLDMFKLTL